MEGLQSAFGSAQLWSEGAALSVEFVTEGGDVVGEGSENQDSLTVGLGKVWKSQYFCMTPK